MQFSIIFLSSLSFGYAFAQENVNLNAAVSPASTDTPNAPSTGDPKNSDGKVKVHVVKVGADKATKFEPNKIIAEVGDMVQFQFAGGNHTVAQSTFDKPCVPISMVDPKVKGFYSGYMPTSADADMLPTYTIMISNLTPVWIYCSQGKHCEKGMQLVINENTKANASRTLENYSALAANAVTVQVKEDEKPSERTPSSPSGTLPKPSAAAPKPSGVSSKTGDKSPSSESDSGSGSGSGSGSSSGSSNGTKTDDSPKVSPSPISASDKNTASIIVCALAGLFAFAIVM